MKLDDYIHERRLTNATFAAMVGVNQSTISRLRKPGRLPTRQVMADIYHATDGLVQANDFYE